MHVTEVQVDLELDVSRREAPRIEKTKFVGNERLTEGALRDVMRLKASGAFSWATGNDRFDPALLDDDLARQGSFEYVFGLGSRLRLVGFFDLGNVYATDFEGLDLPGLRYDAGGEAQILVPIVSVPVRIGYGSNLDPVEDEPGGRFFVSLAFSILG